jgi:hypothetical protein
MQRKREKRAGTGEWGGADSGTHCAEREREGGEWACTSGVAPTGGTHCAEREGRAGMRRVGRSGRKAEGDGFLSFFPFFSFIFEFLSLFSFSIESKLQTYHKFKRDHHKHMHHTRAKIWGST